MHKTTRFPHFYDVADVKQRFHRSFQDCNWCLSVISNKRQLTIYVYIVVKIILIIKHEIKNSIKSCVFCALRQADLL